MVVLLDSAYRAELQCKSDLSLVDPLTTSIVDRVKINNITSKIPLIFQEV